MSIMDFNDPITRTPWVNVFLQGCYQNRQILEQAAVAVSPMELSTVMGATMAQTILYQAILSNWAEFKAIPSPQVLAIAVHKLVSGLLAFTDEQQKGVLAEANLIFTGSLATPLAADHTTPPLALIKHIHTKSRVEPQFRQILMDNLETTSVDDAFNRISALKAGARSDKISTNPFALGKRGGLGTQFSSGLSWFDELTDGGFITGEAYGILAETGGGKTSLTANAACALAAQGRKVMIFVTEQTFDELTLRAKYWAVAAQKSWKDFMQYDTPEQIPDDLASQAVKQAVILMGGCIHAYDAKQIHGMQDVTDLVMQHRPDVFFLDWAGTMADRIMDDKDNKWDGNRALCLRDIANQTNQIAKNASCAGVVFHQLAPAAGKNPFRTYTHEMAAECKSFCFNLSFGIVLSPRDKNDIMKISCTKSRLGGRKDCIVRLNGPNSTFEPLSGYSKSPGSVWAPGGSDSVGKAPVDRKGKSL